MKMTGSKLLLAILKLGNGLFCEIDGHTIGNGKRGDITEEIQNTYFDIVKGQNQLFSHWLDYID